MADNAFSNTDIEKLIELWREEENLWNITSPGHQKKEAKARSLEKIKEAFESKFTGNFLFIISYFVIMNPLCLGFFYWS